MGGCILVADPGVDDSDASAGGYETEYDDSWGGSDANPDPSGGPSDPSGSSSDGGDDPPPADDPPIDDGYVCGDNLLGDGGFEAGSPSTAWAESSDVFGTPLCDGACTEDAGAAPFEGDWFVWFGGLEEPETASVSQTFTATGDAAFLFFMFEINAAAGAGDDILSVRIDDTEVFMASDAEWEDFDTYREVGIDISDFADGEPHTLTIEASFPGTGLSNFFIDDVYVEACEDTSGDSDSDGGSDTDDTAGDTESGDTDGDTDTPAETDGSDTADTGDTDETTDGGSTGGDTA